MSNFDIGGVTYTTYETMLPCDQAAIWTLNYLKASLTMFNMWFQIIQFIVKKSKCANLAQEISFSAPNSCSLPWLVKGVT
jgi:hypothetical protein